MKRLLLALAIACPVPAAAAEYTTGVLWNPQTIEQWSTGSPGIFFGNRSMSGGQPIELLNLKISGYVRQLELQVYGSEPATLTFPRLGYALEFDPVAAPYWEHGVATIDLPEGVPFIAGTDTLLIESAGELVFVGLNPPERNPGLFVEYPLASQGNALQWQIGLRYTVELLEADTNGDGRIDFFDFGNLKEDFGATAARSDFDRSGRVDIGDFGIMKNNFGRDLRNEAGAVAVPEPDAATLALCAVFLWASYRLSRPDADADADE